MDCGISSYCLTGTDLDVPKKKSPTMATVAAQTILHSAAPGQFDVVAEQLQKIGAKTLKGAWLDDIKLQHHQDICMAGGAGNSKDVNHPLALSMKEKVKAYQDETFGSKPGVTARMTLSPGKEDPIHQLVLTTYAEKIDTSNQRTGAWNATWTITYESDESAQISGSVKLHTYSYEEGNCQLRTARDFGSKTVVSQEDLPSALMDQIVAWEHEILELLTSYPDLVGDNLRSIRRVLPITKTKMKWDVVSHRNVKTLEKTKPAKR
jgi:hypothetical protein